MSVTPAHRRFETPPPKRRRWEHEDNYHFSWRALPCAPAKVRLGEILASWEGTPARSGARLRRQGVDCVNLVAAVLDEAYRKESPTVVPRLSGSDAVQSPKRAWATIRALLRAFPSRKVVDGSLQPGDIAVCRRGGSRGPRNPGHVFVAGTNPMEVWHLTSAGVQRSHVHTVHAIFRVWRPIDKEAWA